MTTARPRTRPCRQRSRRTSALLVTLLVLALAACTTRGPEQPGAEGTVLLDRGARAASVRNGQCKDAPSASSTSPGDGSSTTLAFSPSTLPDGNRGPSAPVPGSSSAIRTHVRGRVVDGVCGTPLAEAGIWVHTGAPAERALLLGMTDADGRYDLTLPRGRYRLLFQLTALDYDVLWYPEAADYGGAEEIVVRDDDVELRDVSLFRALDQPVPAYHGDGDRRIAVIGDSLVQQSTTAIQRAVELIGPTSVRGIASKRIDQMQPIAERFAATDPDTVVIALGSNDANQGIPVGDSLTALARMVKTFERARCVVVLDLNSSTPKAEFNEHAAALNEGIRFAALLGLEIKVAPWNETVQQMLDSEPASEWFLDGLHLTDRGEERYARAMVEAVTACTES